MSQTTTTDDDPLRLSNCMSCGYALQGLPEVGVCPECGRPYDQETVVLNGWARGSHANLANASPRIVVWLCIPAALFVATQVLLFTETRRASWALLCPVIMIGILLWRRWTNPLPSVLQVHASREGCVEVDHITLKRKPSRKPWSQLDRVEIDQINDERYRLRIGKQANWFGLAPALTVDAEVKCTDAQAAALRRRIAQWRAEAAASARTGGFPVVMKG